MNPTPGIDAYSPKEVADRVATVGVAKARLPIPKMLMLGGLGGAFIAIGALYFSLVTSDPTLGYALSRVLGGLVFSTGLILVVVAGAELFTGNNLLVMAWVDHAITTRELLRNWGVVYVANLAGAFGIVALAWAAGLQNANGGAVGAHILAIAARKTALPFWEAFFAGVLCNVLVCLAVWLAMAGRTVTDRILAIVFPISAFVAAGFEHSVANFWFIGFGLALRGSVLAPSPVDVTHLDWIGFAGNLVPVTLGNVVGGGLLVAAVYSAIYRR